mgnify:CR=1 FL=1
MAGLNQNYMAKSKPKTKSDHITELLARIEAKVNKLTIKQLKALHIKHFPEN